MREIGAAAAVTARLSTKVDTIEIAYYSRHMFEIVQSETFERWLGGLRDVRAKAKIAVRLRRASLGNLGDVKRIGDGLSEMRIDEGPGYRVYFMRRGAVLIILLCGGDKATQAADINKAKALATDWKE